MKHTTIAVDLAKSVFEIAVSKQPGRVHERHRLSRAAFLAFFASRQPATVLMEACGSAHHWGRQLRGLGHRVLLLPPHRTRPYVTGNKTDRSDAKGLLEAQRNEQIRAVPVKSLDQQALSALHRLRSAWLAARASRINTVRGLLREFGLVIPLGSRRTHGARSVLWTSRMREEPDRLRAWAMRVEQRRGHNKAAIALANKMARLIWAVWRRDVEFAVQPAAA